MYNFLFLVSGDDHRTCVATAVDTRRVVGGAAVPDGRRTVRKWLAGTTPKSPIRSLAIVIGFQHGEHGKLGKVPLR